MLNPGHIIKTCDIPLKCIFIVYVYLIILICGIYEIYTYPVYGIAFVKQSTVATEWIWNHKLTNVLFHTKYTAKHNNEKLYQQ